MVAERCLSAIGWEAAIAQIDILAEVTIMAPDTASRSIPLWLAYFRAMLIVFVVLLALDWSAYSLCERWLAWPALIPIAIAYPIVMTAIT